MGTIITFKRPDGKDASGYLANAARGDAPGVVVIQEWWGLQDQIKGMCDRFARAGFDALAPDLYKGTVVPYHDTDAAGKEMNSLDFMDATTQTVRGAVQYLSQNGAKVGLTGFCLGGAVTVIGATKIPELAAGVVFYGIPPEQAAKPADVKIPLQAHFANKDDWCTPQLVDGFEKGMKALGRREYEKARDILDALIEEYPEERDVLERARAYRQLCERALEKRPAFRPKGFEDLLNHGVFLHNRGEYDEALKALRQAAEIHPRNEHVLYCLAATAARAGDTPGALKALRSASRRPPVNWRRSWTCRARFRPRSRSPRRARRRVPSYL